MDGSFFYDLSGIGLTYTGGEICPLTNEPRTFTVNVYCMSDVPGDYTGLTHGEECNPYVNIVSQFGCPILDFGDVFYYLAEYSYYWGGPLILIGVAMCLFGRKTIKLSICFAGFLTCVFIACAIYYFTQVNEVSDLEDLTEFWYFLGGGASVGVPIGGLLAKYDRVGSSVLTAWGGYVGGLILVDVAFAYTG